MAAATVAAAGTAAPAAAMHAGIRRSRSEPHLRCPRRAGAALTTSRSIGVFPFQLGAAPLRPPPLPDGGADGSRLLTVADDDPPEEPGPEMPPARRPEAHWLGRLLELRSRFHDPTKRDVLDDDDDDLYRLDADHHDGGCGVSYDDEEEDARWDRHSFAKLLARAPLGDARLFAQLAFLCNMAYVIPEIKVNPSRENRTVIKYSVKMINPGPSVRAPTAEIVWPLVLRRQGDPRDYRLGLAWWLWLVVHGDTHWHSYFLEEFLVGFTRITRIKNFSVWRNRH
jgi:hypothetical protein